MILFCNLSVFNMVISSPLEVNSPWKQNDFTKHHGIVSGSYTRSAKACKTPALQNVLAFGVWWIILIAGGWLYNVLTWPHSSHSASIASTDEAAGPDWRPSSRHRRAALQSRVRQVSCRGAFLFQHLLYICSTFQCMLYTVFAWQTMCITHVHATVSLKSFFNKPCHVIQHPDVLFISDIRLNITGEGAASERGGTVAVSEDAAAAWGRLGEDTGGTGSGSHQILSGELHPGPAAQPETPGGQEAPELHSDGLRQGRRHQVYEGDNIYSWLPMFLKVLAWSDGTEKRLH